MSVGHAKNYCRRKGIEWKDYPQSGPKKGGKVLIFTAEDHKCLVKEGLELVAIVNAKSDSERPPFVVGGDVNLNQVKCFWLKVKCTYCFDFYQLCPLKKKLLANLEDHMQGTKRCKALEDDEVAKTHHLPTSTCKRGRPMMSFGRRA